MFKGKLTAVKRKAKGKSQHFKVGRQWFPSEIKQPCQLIVPKGSLVFAGNDFPLLTGLMFCSKADISSSSTQPSLYPVKICGTSHWCVFLYDHTCMCVHACVCMCVCGYMEFKIINDCFS